MLRLCQMAMQHAPNILVAKVTHTSKVKKRVRTLPLLQ